MENFTKFHTARADLLLEDGQMWWCEYSFFGGCFSSAGK